MYITAAKILLLCTVVMLCLSACAPNSGIFAGGDWQSSGLQHQHIRTLAVDFNNPQDIYAGGSQGKLFASTDGGQHWHERSTGLPPASSINALSFDTTGKELYAATNAGLFRSTDAALHWLAMGEAKQPFDYTTLAFDLKAPRTIYAGTAFHGVLMSLDGGNTWSSINTGLPPATTINALTIDIDSEQLWAATNSGVYRSDDKGKIWQAFNTGLPSSAMVNSIQSDTVVNGGTRGLIFAGTNHGFYFSQDAGVHWKTSSESLVGTSIHVIYVDFHKPTTVFVGTDVGALRSDDSGQTWSGIGPGMPKDQPVYSLAWGTGDYSQLFAAADDVYLYPGTSGGLTLNRLIAIVIVALFFYLLYRLTRRRRKVRNPERTLEQTKGGEERSEKDSVV
jgi:ligand-binding sensor domain-containing protein